MAVEGAELKRQLEWGLLALILAVGAWLRFSHLDLLEFQGDEAYAAQLALRFVQHGQLPTAGLMSSVGVTNPPLFIYLLIPMFAISANPVFVSACIALLGLAAVVMCWWIGRKYYGTTAGLVAAAFFAVSPWAVIYSRKIWAQDFVPVFATATMWAVHALAFGKKPRAIFWVVLLPLCVVQIHFSGLALTAAVVVMVAWLRPKIDWRFAVAGLATAVVVMLPYLNLQRQTGWADFKQARQQMGGGKQWEQLHGVTTHPITGYRLPSKQNLSYALAIMNAGRIEDVLGIAAGKEFDQAGVWGRTRKYFTSSLDAILFLQRLAFVAALVWLGIIAAQSKFKSAPTILLLWFVVPVAVFYVTGLWTYLTYFAILYPVHFLVLGALVERALPGKVMAGIAVFFAVANVIFMLDYYRFVGQNGGAQGTFGTGLGYKQQAARYLAERGGEVLQQECETQLALTMTRNPQEQAALAQKLQQPMLIELNHEGRAELAQLEWPMLITQAGRARKGAPTMEQQTIVLVDGNREALRPEIWQQLAQYPGTNFGPIKLYFMKR